MERGAVFMKLISTDFSNLGKKTIYDFGDDEAIDELLKDRKSTRERITKEFFDDAESMVRFQWMKNLAGMLLYSDPNAKKFFKAVEKEFDKYWKHREEKAKKGIIID
ncbi:MAG: hypothetical protein KIG97_04625 [Fibrobacter sp.]|uniref:hypothetical protein n=1 Tax=Fibrobacter sp. TaxID=35828 RepID=UPI0025C18A1E|nr:hypothetical protein [Fibrobacter sp.]MBS7271648.1 hypothetical protein [Fibrobacter sp.]